MRCHRCHRTTREPVDEYGTHPCPGCGWDPTLWDRARDAADRIAAALHGPDPEEAASVIEEARPDLDAFTEQEA